MKRLGQAEDDLECAAEAGIRAIALWPGDEVRYRIAATPVASPLHRATAHACCTVEHEGKRWFLQQLMPDMASSAGVVAAAAAAARAGELGIAPRVVAQSPADGTVVFEHLPDGFRWGRVDDLADEDVMRATLACKRRLHQSAPLANDRDPFAVLDDHASRARAQAAPLPADHDALMLHVGYIRQAVEAAGVDRVPCHGDGVSSNLMIAPGPEVRLVDFDSAGNTDRLYDLASLLVEAHQFDDDARRTIELAEGRCEEAVFARCRLYGIVDDLLWGTWGLLTAAISPRTHIEFFKYGEWRLLRCRFALRDPRFEQWLRTL